MSETQMPASAPAAEPHDAIDLSQLTRAERYKMLTGAVIPRPIAFVTTIGPNGAINAAPFSQFVIIAVDPGLLGISIGPRPAGPKDTLVNIQATGEFVINMVPESWAEAVQQSSEEYPAEVSEVEELGLACIPSVQVRPPRLASSPVHFECRLERIIELGSAPNHFVVGEVVMMHVARGLSSDCKIDPEAYAPLARIGGRNYVRFGEIIRV
jgi:flavin reductase (DIM6/NTAB) family NADH-FMN oxidoreductase RutF